MDDGVVPGLIAPLAQPLGKISGFDAGLTSDNNFSQHKEKLMAGINA
ncbi:hypothetical protein [Serratia entomophila]|nr:hypothetical protein [Serratia entomophila]